MNEVKDRRERFKVRLLNRPVVRQAIAQERATRGTVEPTTLRFGAHHFAEAIAVIERRQASPNQAHRTPRKIWFGSFGEAGLIQLGGSMQESRHLFWAGKTRGKPRVRIVIKGLADHSVQARVLTLSPVRIMHPTAAIDRASLHSPAIDLGDRQGDCGLGDLGLGRDRTSDVSIGHPIASFFEFGADQDGLVVDRPLRDDQVGQEFKQLCRDRKRPKGASRGDDSLQDRW